VLHDLQSSGVPVICWPGQMRPAPAEPVQEPPKHVTHAQQLARQVTVYVVPTNWPPSTPDMPLNRASWRARLKPPLISLVSAQAERRARAHGWLQLPPSARELERFRPRNACT
jgi:hypothetical protein